MFKKLWAFIPLVFLPMIFCASCNWNYIHPKQINNYDVSYNTLKKSSKSIKDLLYGQSNYYDGNYIFIIGTSLNPKLQSLIGQNSSVATGVNSWTVSNQIIGSALDEIKDFKLVDGNIGVFSYIIDDVQIPDKQDGVTGNYYDPFTKWTHDDEHAHDNKAKYNDTTKWQKKHKEGDYAINSNAAKEYRKIVSQIQLLFGDDVFAGDLGGTIDNKTFSVLGWHEGHCYNQYFNSAYDVTFDTFYDWTNKLFTWTK